MEKWKGKIIITMEYDVPYCDNFDEMKKDLLAERGTRFPCFGSGGADSSYEFRRVINVKKKRK